MQGDKRGGGRPSPIGEAAGARTLQPGGPQQRMRQAGVALAIGLTVALAITCVWMGWQHQGASPGALPLDEASMAGHAVIAVNPSDALHGIGAPATATALAPAR